MEILSYGGGIQTAALSILNAMGRIAPVIKYAIFADTGAEMPGTYGHLEIMRGWLARHEIELHVVRSEQGPLEDYIRERSTVIPIRLKNGIGHRQCTRQWKVEVIEQWLKERGIHSATVQLGISLDEYHRMKDSPKQWIKHKFPLIDLRLTRDDCRRIIEEAGLPIPPKSACYFCPFHRHSTWQNLATYEPELFERAAQLEDIINSKRKTDDPAYLSSKKLPLRQAFSIHQLPLELPDDDDPCGGFCFT